MDKRQSAVLFAITATQFAVPFMLSGVAVALPTMGREFHAAATHVSLMESSYIAVVTMFMLPVGKLSDMVGRGRIFLLGLALFTLASLLLAFSTNLLEFILLRAFQGVGGAMTLTTGLAIISDVFPREERGQALGIVMGAVFLGVSLGPTCGGIITSHMGWRWIFHFGALLCITALVLALGRLPKDRGAGFEPMDWAGILLSALTFGLLTAGGANFHETWGKACLLLVPLCASLFVLAEHRSRHPLLDLGLLRSNTTFTFSCLAQMFCYAGMFGFVFLHSLHLQYVRGIAPIHAGLLLAIQPMVQALLSPPSGRLADRFPGPGLAAYGLTISLCAYAMALFTTETSPLGFIIAGFVLLGIGNALFSAANINIIMGSVVAAHYGMASALTGASRTAGMTFSMSIIGLILAVAMGHQPVTLKTHHLYQSAMHASLIGLFLLVALGTWLAYRVPATPKVIEENNGQP